MKTCCKCKLEKSLDAFNKNKSRKDGYNTICRECSNARSRQYYQENTDLHKENIKERNKKVRKAARLFINEYKASKGCKYCPEKEPCCLDLHHRRDKKKEVSLMVGEGYSIATLQVEVDKCDVACRNCHAKIHAGLIKEV